MIVTGTTAIAQSSRTAQLSRRPVAWLQWEAIIDDPFGASAVVLAFSVVLVPNSEGVAPAGPALALIIGVVLIAVIGLFGWRLQELGIADAALIGSLAFVLVAVTGLHFGPICTIFGLMGGSTPGVMLIGGSSSAT